MVVSERWHQDVGLAPTLHYPCWMNKGKNEIKFFKCLKKIYLRYSDLLCKHVRRCNSVPVNDRDNSAWYEMEATDVWGRTTAMTARPSWGRVLGSNLSSIWSRTSDISFMITSWEEHSVISDEPIWEITYGYFNLNKLQWHSFHLANAGWQPRAHVPLLATGSIITGSLTFSKTHLRN